MPQKRRARPAGATIGGVGAFTVSELPVFKSVRPIDTIFAASSLTRVSGSERLEDCVLGMRIGTLVVEIQ